METTIVNRVAQSSLVTIDPSTFREPGEIVEIDVKDRLFMGIVLKEKDFRAYVNELDVESFRDKHAALHCSSDAIVPVWAYMLLASTLAPAARTVFFGTPAALETELYLRNIRNADFSVYRDKRVALKGCGGTPPAVYVELTARLRPWVKSLMYGEPCSTVPIFKQK
ncbi:MAG: DUF2480 family protein [Bacteroidia bacterium]|nr:DUF2480 family protein [Bacteroidia bacterium]MDW8334218.1 DUF2480 family protein [Bacteroidia bacterium]